MKILNVTLIKRFENGAELEGGVFQAKFPNVHENLYWYFFESRYWTAENGGTLVKDAPSSAYVPLDGKYIETRRDGKTVDIMYRKRLDVDRGEYHVQYSKEYTFVFASEQDARTFTGED